MEEERTKYSVATDEHNNILGIAPDGDGIVVESDLNLCMSNVIFEEHGIPLYKVENGEVVRRTDAMIEEDVAAIVEPIEAPSQLDRIEAQLLYVAAMTDCLI